MNILGKNFKEACKDFLLEQSKSGTFGPAEKRGAEMFAQYLDGFNFLTPELQVVALQAGRQVDRACLDALIEHVGKDKAESIIMPIVRRFKRQ